MPLNDYFNPAAARPDASMGGGLPNVLGRLSYFPDRDRYDQLMGLQQLMAQESLRRTKAENTSYEQDDPLRSAQRQAGIGKSNLESMVSGRAAQTPGYADAKIGGEMGDSQTRQAQGALAMNDIEGQKRLANMERAGKTWEQAAQQLEYSQAAGGGIQSQAQWQGIYKTLPEGVREHFSPTFTPDTPKQLKALSASILNNYATQRKMMEERIKTDSAEKVGAGHDAASRYSADQRYAAAFARFPAEKRRKYEDKAVELLDALIDPKTPPEARPQLEKNLDYVNQVMYGMQFARNSGLTDPNAGRNAILGATPQSRSPITPPAAPTQAPAGGGNDVQKLLESTGVPYEPEKYEYRVGPNGKVQRKPKGK